jgi:fibro-slime domain-containing protein
LAIDLGGVHNRETKTVNLDAQAAELGIAAGGSFAMDIFQAERHTSSSNFRIETTIECLEQWSCSESAPQRILDLDEPAGL